MGFIILGGLALLVLVMAGRASGPPRIRREWRFLSSGGAICAFIAAALLMIRDAWLPGLLVAGIGLSLLVSSRIDTRRKAAPPKETMSLADARAMLGVGPEATEEEIQAAYLRLMRRVHPNAGGASGLAAQLNAARDRLLGK